MSCNGWGNGETDVGDRIESTSSHSTTLGLERVRPQLHTAVDGAKDDQTSYSMQQHRAAPALPEQGRRPARRGTPAPHEILNIRYAVRPHQPTNNASIKRPSPLPGQDRGGALAGKAVQRVIQERISMLSSAEAELRLHNHEL